LIQLKLFLRIFFVFIKIPYFLLGLVGEGICTSTVGKPEADFFSERFNTVEPSGKFK